MKKHHRHENDCLNCGAELQGHFCHECGQENLHIKEPFWHFLSHSISHYFHFDEKFFATLKPLLTQPGFLTQQYIAGKRTRFLQPVSMYIFVSIVYFIVIPSLHPKTHTSTTVTTDSVKTEHSAVTQPVVSDSAEHNTITKAEHKVLTKSVNSSINRDSDIDEKIAGRILGESLLKKALKLDSLNRLYKEHPTEALKGKIDSIKNIISKQDDAKLDEAIKNSGHEGFVRKIMNIGRAIRSPEFKKEFEHYQPKLYFLLMPLFAFFLMLNFRRNHRYYVEHIIFTLHFFTAFFIFEIFVKPIDYFIFHGSSIIGLLRGVAILWYSYRALRVFYERPRWITIRKMITLGIFLAIAFSISYTIIGSIVYLMIE
jgi:hypothetical protein